MANRDLFKRCLYGLAFLDILLLSVFYFNLSQLSRDELLKGGYIGGSIGLLPSCLFLLFAVYGSVATYRSGVFEEQFIQTPQIGRFIDRVIPMVVLTSILGLVIRNWP
jgi:F0F1-type ATP synthase assembly protein I